MELKYAIPSCNFIFHTYFLISSYFLFFRIQRIRRGSACWFALSFYVLEKEITGSEETKVCGRFKIQVNFTELQPTCVTFHFTLLYGCTWLGVRSLSGEREWDSTTITTLHSPVSGLGKFTVTCREFKVNATVLEDRDRVGLHTPELETTDLGYFYGDKVKVDGSV